MSYEKLDNKLGNMMKNFGPVFLRVVFGLGFLMHGIGKLFTATPGLEGFTGMLSGLGFPAAGFFAVLVGVVELVGGLFLILGIFTRISSALLAIIMIVAILTVKISNGLMAVIEPDLLYLSGFLMLMATGAGKYSLSNLFNKK